MKATELRIGNWVNVKNNDSIEQFTQIEWFELDPDEFDFKFEAIHLTEEWLVKFGFKEETWKDKSNLNDKIKEINGYVKDNVWCFIPWGDCKLRFFGRRIGDSISNVWVFSEREGLHSVDENQKLIIYIHKFQNLYFALTGEELTIKTIKNENKANTD